MLPRAGVSASAMVLQQERRQLLDDAINSARSLDKSEADLLRNRMLGGGQRKFTPMMVTGMKDIPDRPRRTRTPNRLGQDIAGSSLDSFSTATNAGTSRRKDDAAKPAAAAAVARPGQKGEKLPTVDRRRVRELQNGKSQLQASTSSFRPIFREAKQMEFEDEVRFLTLVHLSVSEVMLLLEPKTYVP